MRGVGEGRRGGGGVEFLERVLLYDYSRLGKVSHALSSLLGLTGGAGCHDDPSLFVIETFAVQLW